jgi:3-oxoacyl-[acyl-carrier protein] reductase
MIMGKLDGKIALVTGGSRGIGRAISIELAKEGAFVYVNYSSGLQAAEETVKLCGNAQAIGFNVANSQEVDEAISKIITQSGKLDILVNNAGITADGLFVRYKNEDWDKVMGINLNGSFYCSRASAKHMMKQRAGRIINISSIVGEMGNPGQSAYVASKAGLIGLTKSLAKELASRNITVNSITPGFIETDMTHGLNEKQKEQHFSVIPLARYGKPEDIAKTVLFLASDGADYITGQTIGVNGGMYM